MSPEQLLPETSLFNLIEILGVAELSLTPISRRNALAVQQRHGLPVGQESNDFPNFTSPNGSTVVVTDHQNGLETAVLRQEGQVNQFLDKLPADFLFPPPLLSAAYETAMTLTSYLQSPLTTIPENAKVAAKDFLAVRANHFKSMLSSLKDTTLAKECFLFSVWCYLQSV